MPFDWLADDGLDGRHGDLLGALLGTDPQLVVLQFEGQPHLAARLVNHTAQRLVR